MRICLLTKSYSESTWQIFVQHIAHIFSQHFLQGISHFLYSHMGLSVFDDLKDCLRTAGGSGDLLQCLIWNLDVQP